MKQFTGKKLAKILVSALIHLEQSHTERSWTDQQHFANTCCDLEDVIEYLKEPLMSKMMLSKEQSPPTIPEGVYTDAFGNRVKIAWAKFDEEKYAMRLAVKAATEDE